MLIRIFRVYFSMHIFYIYSKEQTKDIIEIVQHKTIEEIQSYLDKFKADFKPVYTAEEFVHDFEDTCKELTEEVLIHKHTKPHIEEEGKISFR